MSLNLRSVFTEGIGFGAKAVAYFGWVPYEAAEDAVQPVDFLDVWPLPGIGRIAQAPYLFGEYSFSLSDSVPAYYSTGVIAPTIFSLLSAATPHSYPSRYASSAGGVPVFVSGRVRRITPMAAVQSGLSSKSSAPAILSIRKG